MPTPTTRPSTRAHETGFTLVELIIVSVLLLAVVTMTMRFLLDVMGRQAEGVTGKRANELTMVALDQMGADFRSTISRDRATGGGLGLDDLGFVETGVIPPSTPRATFANDRLDLVEATPWRMQLHVPTGGGTRCVTYDTDTTSGRMVRTVSTLCPATAANRVSQNVVLPARPAGAVVTPPFRYWAMGGAPMCLVAQLPATASFNALTGTGSMATFFRLASVEVNLKAYALAARAKASSELQSEFAFRSRMSAPYRRAAGCRT